MADTSSSNTIYLLSQIYDPDTNNGNNTIIPAVNQLVVDPNNNYVLYIVKNVDGTTNKSTLEVVKAGYTSITGTTDDTITTSIINYGNTRFYLYYDITNTPTKLTVDKKFVVFGKSAKYYRIIRMISSSTYDVISSNYSASGDLLGAYIPLTYADDDGLIRTCPVCYTGATLSDNDVVILEIYDDNKSLISSVDLFVKPATSLIFNSVAKVITGLDITATQILDENALYLHPGQDVDSLVITPKLIYDNGDTFKLTIDGTTCILYGIDDFIPSYPGQETELVCKYYISNGANVDPSIVNNGMIATSKTIKVITDTSDVYSVKISVIPRWDTGTSKYVLFFFMYVFELNTVYDVTSFVTLLTTFNGNYYDGYQNVQFRLLLNDVLPLQDADVQTQSIFIKLAPTTLTEKYILKDSDGDDYGIYGVEGGNYKRPIINCNTSTLMYNVPQDSFPTSAFFLEMFYYKGRPLYNTTTGNAPVTPTHFTIRDILTNQLLLNEPIPVSEYYRTFSVITGDNRKSTNVICEFLQQQTDNSYKTLYGLPVDII
jgi:hypothetical protein